MTPYFSTLLEIFKLTLFVALYIRFSLTLIDTLDTLAVSCCLGNHSTLSFVVYSFIHIINLYYALSLSKVLGEIEKFEKAVRMVIKDVSFDNDVVVSVFETNIRVLG